MSVRGAATTTPSYTVSGDEVRAEYTVLTKFALAGLAAEVRGRPERHGLRLAGLRRQLEAMKDGCVLANAGHFNVEINLAALEALAGIGAGWRGLLAPLALTVALPLLAVPTDARFALLPLPALAASIRPTGSATLAAPILASRISSSATLRPPR